jgi:hypothetical protein
MKAALTGESLIAALQNSATNRSPPRGEPTGDREALRRLGGDVLV